jgi:hypothetical protein
MKYIAITAIIMITSGFLCSKKDENGNLCKVDLTIISAQAPASVTRGSNIIALVKCFGADLCYSFSHSEVKKTDERIYEIRTKGNYPCSPAICALAIYYAEPTVSIAATLSGQYILRYYNGNTLFKADTVTVN